MTGRGAAIEGFLARAGWGGARRIPLAQDASFRRYERINAASRCAILMDAPPGREDVRPFVRIARQLCDLGLSTPRILAEDAEAGFLLLEDLGDATFTRLLDGGAAPEPLYALATDVLCHLHARPAAAAVPPGVARYDDALFLREAALLTEWYMPAVFGRDTDGDAARSYAAAWSAVLPSARGVPDGLVLRDFHVDNLMRLDGRSGIAACGLLDFQDAVRGPVTYDFVSLVEDARRDVDTAVAAAMRARYLDAFPEVDPAAFDRSCAVLGVQRHCKVLGIFTRLRDRDGKPDYLVHVPRLWRLLDSGLRHEALAPLRDWFDDHIPADRRVVPPARRAA